MKCQWCAGRMVNGRCVIGCAVEPIHLCSCRECGKDYRTGKRGSLLCQPCDAAELREYVAAYAPDQHLTFEQHVRIRTGHGLNHVDKDVA